MSTKPRFYTQNGSTKEAYSINPNAKNVQITVGGRATGNVIIRYRPYLAAHPVLGNLEITEFDDGEYEAPDDNIIALEPQQNGVVKRTFTMTNTRLSAVQIDDSGNAIDDIWVHISEW
jgi:hypothetical protein